MADASLIFPDDFGDYEWEITAKGYFDDVVLVAAGKSYKLRFYDQERLRQEIESELDRAEFFYEPNVMVVRSVTKISMERAVQACVQANQLRALVVED